MAAKPRRNILHDPVLMVENGYMLVGSPPTGTTSYPVLQVRGLAIDLRETTTTTRRVVDHVSFDIAKGTIVGLRGNRDGARPLSRSLC